MAQDSTACALLRPFSKLLAPAGLPSDSSAWSKFYYVELTLGVLEYKRKGLEETIPHSDYTSSFGFTCEKKFYVNACQISIRVLHHLMKKRKKKENKKYKPELFKTSQNRNSYYNFW
uniref:Uncharacterized protein n=1 Tax=Ursus americanus TaxID=9643 RepID=A0A452RMR6_URSAM